MHELAECSMRHHLYPQKYFFEPYDHREQIYKVPFLDDNFLHSLFPYCSYNPTYARPHDVVQYQGVFEVFDHHTHVYPCDCSWQDQQDLSYDTKLLKDYCLSEQVCVHVVVMCVHFMLGCCNLNLQLCTHTQTHAHTQTHRHTHGMPCDANKVVLFRRSMVVCLHVCAYVCVCV